MKLSVYRSEISRWSDSVHYDFRDINPPSKDPTAGTMPVMELLRQHRRRYVLHAESGDIILKHMSLASRRKLDMMLAILYPGYADDRQRMSDIKAGMEPGESVETLPKDIRDELSELVKRTYWPAHLYILGVVAVPMLRTEDDIEELYDRLTEEERAILDGIVPALVGTVDPTTVDNTAMIIADRYHVDLVDAELLDNITVAQSDYLMSLINTESEEVSNMMKARQNQ
ncbi:MAG: hypothetical protein WC096_00535 [Sphaerochaetaceae bacterium]